MPRWCHPVIAERKEKHHQIKTSAHQHSTHMMRYNSYRSAISGPNTQPKGHHIVACTLVMISVFLIYYIIQPQKPGPEQCRCDAECAICDCLDHFLDHDTSCTSSIALAAKEPQDEVTVSCAEYGTLLSQTADAVAIEEKSKTDAPQRFSQNAAKRRRTHMLERAHSIKIC